MLDCLGGSYINYLNFYGPFRAHYSYFHGTNGLYELPALQVHVAMLAERYVPGTVDVASALNIAAFNIGIASGAALGGLVTDSLELIPTGWVRALMVKSAIVLTDLAKC